MALSEQLVNSQYVVDLSRVKLRNKRSPCKADARTSKVTSMIELFSNSTINELNSHNVKYPIRNSVIDPSTIKEVIEERNTKKKEPVTRKRTSISVEVTTPKPYRSDRPSETVKFSGSVTGEPSSMSNKDAEKTSSSLANGLVARSIRRHDSNSAVKLTDRIPAVKTADLSLGPKPFRGDNNGASVKSNVLVIKSGEYHSGSSKTIPMRGNVGQVESGLVRKPYQDDQIEKTTSNVSALYTNNHDGNFEKGVSRKARVDRTKDSSVAPKPYQKTPNDGFSRSKTNSTVPANNDDNTSVKKISRTMNYWQHKIESKNSQSARVSPGRRRNEASEGRNMTVRMNERVRNFDLDGQFRKKDSLQSSVFDGTFHNREHKPVISSRHRVMTSVPSSMQTPVPKPFKLSDTVKVASTLHGVSTLGIKGRIESLEKRKISHQKADTDLKKKENVSGPVILQKSTLRSQDVVNPLPKPQRTFTFAAADANPPRPQAKPRHLNLMRVSSDASALSAPSRNHSSLNDFTPKKSVSSKNSISSGYEEVVFFDTAPQEPEENDNLPHNKKWTRRHVYEDVGGLSNLQARNDYDHINLDNQKQRPRSLSDLEDGYAHLKFQQDLQRTQNHPSLPTSSEGFPVQPFEKRDLGIGEMTGQNDSAKSESMDSGKLQITDKIREAFSTIGRRYKHHKKTQENVEDDVSYSTSGDEDSDNETDFKKHEQTLERVRTLQKTYRRTLKYKSLERELAGAGQERATLFEQVLVCKIMADTNGKDISKVVYRFPAPPPGKPVGDEKTLAHFCFPDIMELSPCTEMLSQSYSFMLTRENGTRKFGYCRRVLPPGTEPRYPIVYCLISALGSFGLYQTILDELERRHRVSIKSVALFLDSLFVERFPAPGRNVHIKIGDPDGKFSSVALRRPYDTRLEHVDLQCLLHELGIENTIKIFSSLLLERRVILCGRSLGILTACVHALRELLYPFVWQHVFVPVLPPPMLDLCCAPTPLLIGILETSLDRLKTLPLEEVLIVNLSTQEVSSSTGDELEILPRKLQTALIESLVIQTASKRDSGAEPNYDHATDYESAERNTVISESFMHLFVEMIGHYQNHFQPVLQSTNIKNRHGRLLRSFNRNSFYEDVTSRSLRRFLELFMETQMFDGFVHSREMSSPNYEGLFEQRITRHLLTVDASHLNFKVFRTKMKKLVKSAITAAGGQGSNVSSPRRRGKLGIKV